MRLASLFLLTLVLTAPAFAFAAQKPASFITGRSIVTASSSPGNVHLFGISIISAAPVAGDLSAVGGSVVATAPVEGDELLLAGSIHSSASIKGDMRAAGGTVVLEGAVSGDLVALGYMVRASERVLGNVFIIAANATLSRGAAGSVTIYGNNISLAGDFGGDVAIVATGRLSVEKGTSIRGTLSYEAPEVAHIPPSATIHGGVTYAGASYLPDIGTSRVLALINLGFFLIVRILGALILAGLLAGLFPRLAETVVGCAYEAKPRSVVFTTLLGFGILVATPVLVVMLTLSFVGMGLALLIFLAYTLLLLLAFLYAGIVLGGVFSRRFLRRDAVRWHDGVFGMLALSLVSLVPYAGSLVVVLLTVFSMGALLHIFFRFAFPHDEQTTKLL